MRKTKRILALGCSAMLVISTLSGCAKEQAEIKETEDVEAIQEALDELEAVSELVKHSSTAGKEETVYAIMNADGQLEQTIVSEWLKNEKGDTSLDDKSDLSDIKVVKGDAEYTEGTSENQIVWKNDGSDIYYQGNSNKELPVDVKISYELDGKKVSAEELAGAEGHLKMKFTYVNNTAKETIVHGKTCTIYQPFVMISGTVLDNSKAQNITVDHGSIVNSGDDTIVFGIAMPGLQESLGLMDLKEDFELPEEVTVEADVTDFSLMMTLTFASNDVLSKLGIDELDSIDDLKADMERLTSGMAEIVDGAEQLADGSEGLSSGSKTLADGVKNLATGTEDLSDGAKKVNEGASQVDEGAAALKDGLDNLKGNTPKLTSGVNSLVQGSAQVASGLHTIVGNNDSLNGGAAALAGGLSTLEESLSKEEAREQMKALVSGSAMFSSNLSSASGQLQQIVKGYDYSSDSMASLFYGLTQYAQELEVTGNSDNIAYASYIRNLMEAYKGLYGSVAKVQSGISSLSDTYCTIDSGVAATADNIAEVTGAVTQLKEGAEELAAGISAYTSGVDQATEGVDTMDAGLNALSAQVPALVGGVEQLSEGADKLALGTTSLSEGTENLASGAEKVHQGTKELKNGVTKLLEGIQEFVTGTGDLKDGVIKFNEEGIQKLADVVNRDLETYFDRFKAVQEYANEYHSYADCADGVESSVKFIYKTDAIEQ